MPLRRNLVASFLGNACVALVQVAFVPIYIALLGVESYGLIGIYALLQGGFALLDAGLTPTVLREVARLDGGAARSVEVRNLLRSVEVVFAILALAVCAILVAATPSIASRWLQAESLPLATVEHALMLMGVLAGVRWVGGLYRSAIAGHQRLVWLNVVVPVFAVARAAGVVPFLLWTGPTIESFFAYQAAVSAAELAVLGRKAWALTSSEEPARFSVAALARTWRFSGGLALVTLLYFVLSQADKAVLSTLVSLAAFGSYAFAASVAGALNLLVAPIGQVAFPRLSHLAARGDRMALATEFRGLAQLMTLAVAPPAIVIALFAQPILLLWTRDLVLSATAAPMLSLLSIGAMLNAFMSVPCMVPIAHGRMAGLVILNGVLLVAFVPAIYLGVEAHGAIAAAGAWIAINSVGVLLAIPLLQGHLPSEVRWRWFAWDVGLPTAAAAAAGGLASLLVPAEVGAATVVVLAIALVAAFAAATMASPLARRRIAELRAASRPA